MGKPIKWELIIAVLGVSFAIFSFFRDITGYEIKIDDSSKGDPYTPTTLLPKSSDSTLIDSDTIGNSEEYRYQDFENDFIFPFDTLSISRKIAFSVSSRGILSVHTKEDQFNQNSKQFISSLFPIRTINRIAIRTGFGRPIFFTIYFNNNTSPQEYITDDFFNETLFLQFADYKIKKYNKRILVDRKVYDNRMYLWMPLMILGVSLPLLMQLVIENIFNKRYKSYYGIVAWLICLVLGFMGFAFDLYSQIK